MGKLLNYDNNETYDCYINEDRGYELNLNECGYEKCSPCHYWEGHKKFYLFHYILRGKGVLRVNEGALKPVRQGQVFLFPRTTRSITRRTKMSRGNISGSVSAAYPQRASCSTALF